MLDFRIIPPLVGSITLLFAAAVLVVFQPSHLDTAAPLAAFILFTFFSLRRK